MHILIRSVRQHMLRQIHQLPVRQRVEFKLAVLVYKSLHGLTATYLTDDCQLVANSGRRRLRSADVDTCVIPRTMEPYIIASASITG